MAIELGKAYVQVMPSMKGITSNLEKEFGGNGEKAGKSFGAKLKDSLKNISYAKIASMATKAITESLNLGAELEQNLGGTEAVFGKFAKTIQKTARSAYKNMGLSASDYMATANKMGSLFQGSGLDIQRSMKLTQDAMQRASDVASVMGIDTTMAMESIAGAAKGNFTMMDNLGVAMNATTLQAYALEKGINFKWNTATQAQKAELAMKMFMDRTSKHAGNFARESMETFSGSLGALSSAWKNVLGSLMTGEGVTQSFKTLGETILAFGQNLLPALGNIFSQLPSGLFALFESLIPPLIESGKTAFMNFISGFSQGVPLSIPQIIATVSEIITNILSNIEASMPLLINSAMNFFSTMADGIFKSLPTIIGSAGDIIAAILTFVISSIPKIIEAGFNFFISLIKNLPQILSAIISAVVKIASSVFDKFKGLGSKMIASGFEFFTNFAKKVPVAIRNLVSKIPGFVIQIVNGFISLGSSMASIGGDMVRGLWNGITNLGSWIIGKIKSWTGNVLSRIKSMFGIASPSKITAGYGAFLVEGLAVGIVKNTDIVNKSVKDMTDEVKENFHAGLAFDAIEAMNVDNLNRSLQSGLSLKTSTDKSEDMERLNILAKRVGEATVEAFVRAGVSINIDKREFGRIVNSLA